MILKIKMPSMTKNQWKKIIALSSNHLFDIGFYGSNVNNYTIQKLCSCPCSSKVYTKWRSANKIYLSEWDQECKLGFTTGTSFVQHLRNHNGWFHQAIIIYLKNLFSQTWFLLPSGYVHYLLETNKQKKTKLKIHLKNEYPIQSTLILQTSTIHD